MALQIIGLFCEDIREEKSGQFSLIGVLPDNISMPTRPANAPDDAQALLPKLGLFIRIHVGVEDAVEPITIKMALSDRHDEVPIGNIDADLIVRAKKEAVANGLPIAGILNRTVFQAFSVSGPGLITVAAYVGEQRHICAALNIRVA